jgi:hypothetical protein
MHKVTRPTLLLNPEAAKTHKVTRPTLLLNPEAAKTHKVTRPTLLINPEAAKTHKVTRPTPNALTGESFSPRKAGDLMGSVSENVSLDFVAWITYIEMEMFYRWPYISCIIILTKIFQIYLV